MLDRGRWWALVNAQKNLRVVQNAGNFLTSWKPVRLSRTLLRGVNKQHKMYSRWLYKSPNAYSWPSALELFKMKMSCDNPPKKETHTVRLHASHTHLEFDVHLVPRADCTRNISNCWFFALLSDRCFSMTGNHIYLPRMGSNTICVITISLHTFTLSIIKVETRKFIRPVCKQKQLRHRVLLAVTTDERS
jgi:hypothetical protein